MTDVLRLALAGALFVAGVVLAAAPTRASSGSAPLAGPQVRFRQSDRRIFLRILRKLTPLEGESVARLESAAGMALVGTPYVAHTLEGPGPEHLVCNLHGLDCMTFVETSLAIALTAKKAGSAAAPAVAEQVFEDELAALRYRTDRPDGYASRLHYFSDWIAHNSERGVVREITRDLGGVPDDRVIDFMTTHADRYPPMADPAVFHEIQAAERQLSQSRRWVLPVGSVERESDRIEEGDILGLVSSAPGLDISHTVLAHRTADGVLHILHAPDVGGRVEVSPTSLLGYLETHPKIVGIRIIRPL